MFRKGDFFIEAKGEENGAAKISSVDRSRRIDYGCLNVAGGISDAVRNRICLMGDCDAPDCGRNRCSDSRQDLGRNREARDAGRSRFGSDLRHMESLHKLECFFYNGSVFRDRIVHIVQWGRFVHFS